MRNGNAWLTQLGLTVACVFCLIAFSGNTGNAAELQATDSGAPSAKVMFPVTGKATASAASMKAVVFNHLIHEKAVAKCETCHHTGDPQACSDCHTVEGKAAGKFITLEKAMHATQIATPAKGNKPASCVSCHDAQLSKRECAGCHKVVTPKRDAQWCGVCHNATVCPQALAKGVAGKLSAEDNLKIATKVVTENKTAKPLTATVSRVRIGDIANEYAPCLFNHQHHIASVAERIKDSKLAAAFHTQPETLCTTCHHNSPLSATPPKCSSCHPAKIDPMNPARPNLKAAFHLQCMGCHQGMKVYRPQDTNCTACHKAAAK